MNAFYFFWFLLIYLFYILGYAIYNCFPFPTLKNCRKRKPSGGSF